MKDRLANPYLERYHSTYTAFAHLTVEQRNTLCLGSYMTDCIAQVRSTDYSGAIIPVVRELELCLKSKFRPNKRRARTVNAFVAYYQRDPVAYQHLCDATSYPDHLVHRTDFLVILKHIAHYRAQAGHAYISRKGVGRCLTWSAMLINVLNTMESRSVPVPPTRTRVLGAASRREAGVHVR